MSKNDEFEKYSYLINYEVEFRFYVNIWAMIFFLIGLFTFTYMLFKSNRGLITVLGIDISGYYLVYWLMALLGLIPMFYRFFYVDKKRVVVGLNFDDGLKIKLKWGPIIDIDKFTLILNKRKLKYVSQIPGFKPRKKYDYNYVGVQHNDTIYVIPYAEGYREDLISLLEKTNQLKPTPKIY
ncbi:hypothetical protein [Psychrobacter sp.]|uniref:hypothetical protein n=1 Tax=Psychrobacter sp. TaxID=56811 RepID=UPI0025F37848|nr:hypothetical protein [Psychrobacter sp.]